jgi:hypothetical protein
VIETQDQNIAVPSGFKAADRAAVQQEPSGNQSALQATKVRGGKSGMPEQLL